MTGSLDHSTSSDQEQLVAYLDGELAPEEAQRVERRLSQDEDFRQLLRTLQGTWDMLDELPQPTLDDTFTRTTVEMVAVRLSEDVAQEQTQWQRRRGWRRLAGLGLIAASVGLGFWAARQWQERSNRELLEDLPVIERVDLYAEVDDLDFLVSLAEAGIFTDQMNEEPASELP